MFKLFNAKHKRVYLDHAGATPVSALSRAALVESMAIYGNPSGIHKEGVQAGLLLDKARALCAKALNAHAYEIYFTGTGTESCNLAVLGTYDAYMKDHEGAIPHMIVSSIEHPAVMEPVRVLEKKKLIRVTYLSISEEGIVKLSELREALSSETILVSVMYANNEIGTLQPVKEIGRAIEEWKTKNDRTHTAYPYFHIDACQAGNYCNLDVVRLRAHLMTVNASKVYGPKGIALLYKREGIRLSPYTFGGGQERELRSGTESVALAYAFGVALQESQAMRDIETKRLQVLNDYCKKELIHALPNIVFYGAFDEVHHVQKGHDEGKRIIKRLPNNINCRIPGITSEEMILRLDAEGFAVSHKSACASQESDGSYVIGALGGSESEALENIRITFGRDTTKKDVTNLILAMQKIASKYIQ
jgi:cysteine desulfurase